MHEWHALTDCSSEAAVQACRDGPLLCSTPGYKISRRLQCMPHCPYPKYPVAISIFNLPSVSIPVMLSPRGQSGLEAKILASATASASRFWPCLTSLVYSTCSPQHVWKLCFLCHRANCLEFTASWFVWSAVDSELLQHDLKTHLFTGYYEALEMFT